MLFKAGKARDGYFTNEDILQQAGTAMDILTQHFPSDDHVFVFDNATTHLKRADTALSAHKMPKSTPKGGKNWGVEVLVLGADGKPVYGTDGKVRKQKVCMGDATFPNGTPQCLYFPETHPHSLGIFKGMAVLLEEHGHVNASKMCAECKGFKCTKGATAFCCRHLLYNEPDFAVVELLLEMRCKSQGFQAIFLPKFHCELNFIEQCWGYSKKGLPAMPCVE